MLCVRLLEWPGLASGVLNAMSDDVEYTDALLATFLSIVASRSHTL